MNTPQSKQAIIVQPKKRIVGKVDNPYQSYYNVLKFSIFMLLMDEIRRETGVEEAGLRVLSLLCESYLQNGKGLTAYGISELLSPTRTAKNDLINTRAKCKRLRDKGYIEASGIGKFGACVYIPSKKALDRLNAICKQV